MHKARLTTALLDYISPFFQKRINSISRMWSQLCLFIYQLIYLSINNDHNYWAVAIRSKLDLGFGCHGTWNNVLPSLFIKRFSVKFFVFYFFVAGLCFHQKLFWYCPSCLLDGCIENSQLQWLLQTLVLHFQWRWMFCSSTHRRSCLHADRW